MLETEGEWGVRNKKKKKPKTKPQCHQFLTITMKLQNRPSSENKLPRGLQMEATVALSWVSLTLFEKRM